MEAYVLWFIVGVVLVIVELLTGTMFLLVLGIAAIAAAAAAYFGFNFLLQVIVAAIVAAVLIVYLQSRRKGASGQAAPALEMGQPVNFESWVDRERKLARVRFRGSLWDATVEGEAAGTVGEVLYVKAVHGATLVIAKKS